MGFGSFLKKAINPLTPFKAIGSAGKNLVQGNVKGALRNMTLDAATMGLGPGTRRSQGPGAPAAVSPEAQAFFNSQSGADQQGIMESFGNRPNIQGWYENAKAAGSVPASPSVSPIPQGIAEVMGAAGQPQAAPQPSPMGAAPGVGAAASPIMQQLNRARRDFDMRRRVGGYNPNQVE
ncbi:MAG: hypothetical protein A2Y61_02545 [Chloroflexi bacterium RBG_13_60_13]|nr:MAG: hypothetical protein A2Y61_02545 [Chloroflexi bacterium RBG_13_60_13]